MPGCAATAGPIAAERRDERTRGGSHAADDGESREPPDAWRRGGRESREPPDAWRRGGRGRTEEGIALLTTALLSPGWCPRRAGE